MVLDDTLLADPGELESRDTAGDLRAAATAGAQIRSTLFGATEAGVGDLRGHRPRALVLLRRPGVSGAAADLTTALLGPQCPVPVVVADPAAVAVARHGAATLATQAGVVAHAADLGQAGVASGLVRAVDLAEREHDVFHDPFDDPTPAQPPLRLLLLGTGEQDPQAASRLRLGREWPGADVVHPVEEVPRGARDAVVTRAVLLTLRLDIAAIYLGLAQGGGA